MAPQRPLARKAVAAPLPNEIISLITKYLPRDELSQARHISKAFAAVTASRLFETIPLWLGLHSLQALTQLSQHPQLRHHVKTIVFSPLHFIDHEDDIAYLSRTRSRIRLSTDSSSLSDLLFLKHRSAYRAFIEDQRSLIMDNLDVSILTHAFKQLPKLEDIVLDHGNTTIGADLLYRELGPFDSADLLTCDCLHPLPVLLRAMSTAEVEFRSFTIGMMPGFAASSSQIASLLTRDESNPYKQPTHPKRIDPGAFAKTFQDDGICSWLMFRHLRTLKLQGIETKFEDTKGIEHIGTAIGQLLELATGLESLVVRELGSAPNEQPNMFVDQ